MTRNLAVVRDSPQRMVAYIRVSALMGRGGEDFHSPDVQLSAIRRAAPGLREVAVIEDIDQTGRHFNREGIDRVRELAEARQIDVLAVYDLSRLGRNVREALDFIDWLTKNGVGVVSASENVDTSTPSGRLMLQQFLSFAEFYSNTLGKSWSAVIERRAEAGLTHGHRAMGYIRENQLLSVHPVEGPAMTRAFERYADGDPIGEICRELGAATGRRIWAASLKTRFRNAVYRGMINRKGRLFQGRHDALVTEQVWDLVQARLKSDQVLHPREISPVWPMVGLCHCPRGHRLIRRALADTTGGPKIPRLVCGRNGTRGTDPCSIGSPQVARVEKEVLRQVAQYVRSLRDDAGVGAAKRARASTARADKSSLETQLKSIRAAMARIAKEWALERLDEETYRTAMSELRDTEDSLIAALVSAAQVGALPTPKQVADAGERLLELWDEMTIAEQNRQLRSIVKSIVVREPHRYREPETERTQVVFY